MKKGILMTTGTNFEGFVVDQYLDVISEEIIFKNSFMKKFLGSIGDIISSYNILDCEMMGATKLIANGKKYARERFEKKVEEMGGNAALGVRFESTFGTEVIRIAISGTAVQISPDIIKLTEKRFKIQVSKINTKEIRVPSLDFYSVENHKTLSLCLYDTNETDITGVKCDVILCTDFKDFYVLKDQLFTNFTESVGNYKNSELLPCVIPDEIAKSIHHAGIVVKKYIIGKEVHEIKNAEIESYEEFMTGMNSALKKEDLLQLVAEAELKSSTKEIYDYLVICKAEGLNIFTDEFMARMEKQIEIERLYGNITESTIRILKDYIEAL